MPLVFPNIVRFSVVGEVQGEACVMVLDTQVEYDFPGPPGIGREERIFDVAGDILNNYTDHLLPLQNWAYQAQEVRWVDLDSEDGSTGSRTSTSAESWPQVGAVEAAGLPNNVYAKVRKTIAGKSRQARQGVTRFGGLSEANTGTENVNVLTPTFVGQVNDGFEAFKDGVNGTGVDAYTINLGVLHTVNAVATGWSPISTWQCQSTVGTIRRRMPGYGD